MSKAKRVLKNLTAITFSQIIIKIVRFLFLVYILRTLLPFNYGKFIYILSALMIYFSFADFGLNAISIREIAKKPSLSSVILGRNLQVKFFIIIVILLISFSTFLNQAGFDMKIMAILIAISMSISAISSSLIAVLEGYKHYVRISIIRAISEFIYIAVSFALIHLFQFGVSALAVGHILMNISLLLMAIYYIRKLKVKPILFNNPFPVLKILVPAVSIGITSIFVTVYFKIDKIMIKHMLSTWHVGIYSAAFAFMNKILLIPQTVCNVMFPEVASLKGKSETELYRTHWFSIKINLILAVPIITGGILLAKPLFYFLFTNAYAPSVKVFQLLMIAFFFMFINSIQGSLLISIEKEKILAVITFCAMCANIAGNYILIQKIGVNGAAISTIFSELTVFILTCMVIKKIKPVTNILKILVIPFASVGVMCIFIYFAEKVLNVLLLIAGGAIVYTITLLILMKRFSKSDYSVLKRALKI